MINKLKVLLLGKKKIQKTLKPQPSDKKTIKTANYDSVPYLNTRRKHSDILGSLIDQKLTWQAIAIGCFLLLLSSISGIAYIGSQSKIVPYIVEVPTNHIPVALGTIAEPSPVNDKIIEATISQWIENIRTVSPDLNIEIAYTKRVYSHLLASTPAYAKAMEIYTSDLRPETRAANYITVDINITSVLKESPSTWQVDWIETVRSRSGAIQEQFKMKALVTTTIIPPIKATSEENLRLNPLGIFIQNYSWSRVN